MQRIAALLLFAVALLPPGGATAHDSWISRGGLRNSAGEWCCGAGDCAVMDAKAVGLTSAGYIVAGYGTILGTNQRERYRETVPLHEAQPSPDGAYWRCRRPDGSRRCFFAPPPGS
ncbi:MAG: hypothetical protein GEU91_14075 [Rhizobiales bacterium]|nr:hypothetical protein [Hyphomicrobiales bacterium]